MSCCHKYSREHQLRITPQTTVVPNNSSLNIVCHSGQLFQEITEPFKSFASSAGTNKIGLRATNMLGSQKVLRDRLPCSVSKIQNNANLIF